MRHRSRLEIYVDILGRLHEQKMGPTRLSRFCNLSYDKCVEMLGELEARALVRKEIVEGHDIYGITQEGYQTVEDFSKVWRRVYPDTHLR